MSSYTMLYEYCTRNFGGRFYFYFSLVFCILGAFLTKQLFHWLLWNYDYSQLCVRRVVRYLPSHIQRALVE